MPLLIWWMKFTIGLGCSGDYSTAIGWVQVPFNLSGAPDRHAPENVIADVGAGGLGLPDRDYT